MKSRLVVFLIVVIKLSLSETENESLQLKKVFDQNGPLVQVILDGTGIGTDDPNRNPVVKANSTYFQKLVRDASSEGLFMKLRASSEAVGLPPLNNGNSEAGHMTMGALKIYSQNTKLVDEAIESGSILRTEAWKDIVIEPSRQNKTIHFTGLLSDGNCFSHINHLFKLLEAVASSGAKRLRVHATLDGVDVQTLGLVFIEKLEKKLAMLRKDGIDAQISSGGGRAYTSIVKNNAPAVRRGWNAMHGLVDPAECVRGYLGYYTSAEEAIKEYRRLFPEGDDTKNLPFVIVDKSTRQPVGKIEDGDSVINYNYRGDYQMMITEAFEAGSNARVPHILSENDPRAKDVKYASLMQYDSAANIPRRFFVEGTMISNVLMDYVIANGKRSFLVSETYKFAHLERFYNGNNATNKNPVMDVRVKIDSNPDHMTEAHPEMKSREVTDRLLAALWGERKTQGKSIQTRDYDFYRVNLANPDMVGHTGNFTQCVEAFRVAMECLERIDDAVRELGGTLLVLADHGNIEEKTMNKSLRSHTQNLVPFLIRDYTHPSRVRGHYRLVSEQSKPRAREGEDPDSVEPWGLSNVGATVLNLLGLEAPAGPQNRDSLLVLRTDAETEADVEAGARAEAEMWTETKTHAEEEKEREEEEEL